MEKLPKRNEVKLLLKSNIIDLKKDSTVKFYQYSIVFPSTLSQDKQKRASRSLENKVLETTKVGAILYYEYLYSTLNELHKQSFQFQDDESQKHILKLNFVKEFQIDESNVEVAKRSKLVPHLLRILFSKSLTKNGYKQIGKTSVFINIKQKTQLQNQEIYEFRGFEIKINLRKQLLVVPISKLVKSNSVLQQIQNIYLQNKNLSKDARRSMVIELVEGMGVMTNYGKNLGAFYKIIKVDFEKNVLTPNLIDGSSNLMSYYKQKYGIQIIDVKQPLLIAKPKNKNSTQITFLVPQLCLSVGLGLTLTAGQRAKITKATTKAPDKFFQTNMKAVRMFQEESVGKMFNLKFQDRKASTLPLPIVYSCQQIIKVEQSSGFIKIANRKLAAHPVTKRQPKVMIIHSNYEKAMAVSNFIVSIANGYDYRFKTQIEDVSFKQNYLSKINNDKIIYVVILPRNCLVQYIKIKKHSLDHSIITQVLLEQSINRMKNLFTYMNKVMLQLLSKNGIGLWQPTTGTKSKQSVMIMGITFKNFKGKRLAAYVNSLNQEITSFHSRVVSSLFKYEYQEPIHYTIESLTQYKKVNGKYPENIIILHQQERQSPEFYSQIDWSKIEVPFKCSVTFVSVNDRSLFRFFSMNKSTVENAQLGALIEQQNTSQFHFITENNPHKTTKPVGYNIVKLGRYTKDQIQRILYAQCFNYYNWNGPVKLPSCLQYCKKMMLHVVTLGIVEYRAFETLPYL